MTQTDLFPPASELPMPAPKVTPEEVDKAIKQVDYIVLPDGRTTIAMVTMDNDFTVRGESSCVSLANYNQGLGEKYALDKARDKVWMLLGFRLADRLHRAKRAPLHQCAVTGEYVTPEYAAANPATTYKRS